MALPGDGILPEPKYSNTLAVTVDAQPDAIWPWMVQMGQDRAGYYTHSWLENLSLCKMPSVDEIVPKWQQRAVGDFVPTWRGKLGWTIGELEDGQSISYRNDNNITMTVVVIPTSSQGSRLLMRLRTASNSNPLMRLSESLLWKWAHCFMGRGVLEGIRQRAVAQSKNSVGLEAQKTKGRRAERLRFYE